MIDSTFSVRKGKKLAFLAVLFFVAVTGSLNAQITFRAQDPTLGEVIEHVRSQSDYQFFYDTGLTGLKVRSADVADVSIDDLLSTVLGGTGVDYKIENKIVYLSQSPRSVQPTQQERLVTGTVTDLNGSPLPGVAVTISGTAIGVSTGMDGKYTIRIPASAGNLVFSYLGYETQTIDPGSRNVVDVVMKESAFDVGGVVVTAMGIKREEKSLTYNVQSIGASEFQTVKDVNLMNSLAGKVAGVTINQSSSGLGGSSRVVMRGTKSLFGDNNALYVVDGIPLANIKSTQSDNYYEVDVQGDTEGIAMLNPDDIESMTILTGAAAAALYGNRGSNGVVLITTKKGASTGTKVSYTNTTTFSSPFVMPKFQNTYGQSPDSYASWGEKLATPSSYKPKDFFQTGTNTMNTVSLSTGNENHQMYASVGSVNARGIIPNQKYERYNFNMRTSNVLIKDKLDIDLGVNYIDQRDQNAIAHGLYFNPLVAIYLFPPGDDINRFLPYKTWNAERNFQTQNWAYSTESLEGLKQNPFWIVNRNLLQNRRNRVIFSGSLNYNIFDWMSLSLRARLDRATSVYERKLYASTDNLFAHSENGHYTDYTRKDRNMFGDFLLNIDKGFGDWRLTANVGGSFNDEIYDYKGYAGYLSLFPDHFYVGNMNIEVNERERSHVRTTALYATAQVGYKSMVFFDLTGRIDYFSTLKSVRAMQDGHVWCAYPSVGLSGVLTEMFDIPRNVLPFWKVRASYTQVGNPPPAYLLDNYTSIVNNTLIPGSYPQTIDPERTKGYELGTDFRLWDNRFDVSFTYYNTNTYNQIFEYDLPPSTGYSSFFANAGKVNNWGIELKVGVRQDIGPVKWNGTVTYSLNRNKVKQLLGDTVVDPISGELMDAPQEFQVAANIGSSYRMVLTKGGTMSDIYVNSFKLDEHGYVYVHPVTGAFSVDTDNYIKIGSAAPLYNLSLGNTFAWNGLTLGFMIDARVGGIVVSSTQALMDQYGVSRSSAEARDRGGAYINKGLMDAQSYYTVAAAGKTGAALSEYTYSATNVRFRELSLGYSLPAKWLGDKLHINVSVIARNLLMFYCKAPFDPELTSNTGTYYQGYDYFMPPSQRSIGFGVNVSF